MADQHETDKLWDLIRSIEVAMMVTEDGDYLRGRPMIGSQSNFDGTLWFFTRASSHKVDEVAREHRVNLSYAHPGKQDYVSVSGLARLVRDRSEIETHWSESLRVWFPNGKDDPDIALLQVTVQRAEFWDAPSSAMLHAYGYVKAALTGKSPQPGGHGTVKVA